MNDEISRFFRRHEFECKCGCGFNTVDIELVLKLCEIRNKLNIPIVINSGCRCESRNYAVGGAKNSFHLRGQAVDISKTGVPDLYHVLDGIFPQTYGIKEYVNHVHFDIRFSKFRERLIQ